MIWQRFISNNWMKACKSLSSIIIVMYGCRRGIKSHRLMKWVLEIEKLLRVYFRKKIKQIYYFHNNNMQIIAFIIIHYSSNITASVQINRLLFYTKTKFIKNNKTIMTSNKSLNKEISGNVANKIVLGQRCYPIHQCSICFCHF